MVSKKTYIILGIILTIFTLTTLFFAFSYEGDYFTIISDPSFKANYDGDKWSRVTKKLHVLGKNYEVYDETGYIGNYNVSHLSNANRWYVYDKDMNEIQKKGSIFALKSNMNYTYDTAIQQEITQSDLEYIDKILKENKIDTNIDYAFNMAYDVDLTGNGKNDRIIISNLYQDARNNDDAYGMALAIIKDNIHTLYFNGKLKDTSYTVMHASLTAVFDLKKDGYREVLITSNSFGLSSSCISLYEITKEGPSRRLNC